MHVLTYRIVHVADTYRRTCRIIDVCLDVGDSMCMWLRCVCVCTPAHTLLPKSLSLSGTFSERFWSRSIFIPNGVRLRVFRGSLPTLSWLLLLLSWLLLLLLSWLLLHAGVFAPLAAVLALLAAV